MHVQATNPSNSKSYFTFEGKQYYAQVNAPGYVGLMLFTGSGIACEKAFHPELWFFYEQQKNISDLRTSEIF